MVRFLAQHGVEERLACRFFTTAVRLDRDEDGIDLRQLSWIIATQSPAPVLFVIHVKNAQIHGLSFFSLRRFLLAPGLERACVLNVWLVVQVESVKYQRFALRVEYTPERFPRAAAAVHIEYVGDIKLSRAHQFANVPVR